MIEYVYHWSSWAAIIAENLTDDDKKVILHMYNWSKLHEHGKRGVMGMVRLLGLHKPRQNRFTPIKHLLDDTYDVPLLESGYWTSDTGIEVVSLTESGFLVAECLLDKREEKDNG